MQYSPHALLDLRYPDFTARHVFTAKLRLVILIGFWGLCVFFYPPLLTAGQPIMLIISLTFVLTTICYAFILKGVWPIFFFIFELVADVAAQTVLVYLTGGIKSNFFTVYLIYCAAGGLFYNYRVAAVISAIAIFFYSGLALGTYWGWIGEFPYPFQEASILKGVGPFQNLALLLVFLLIAIYGIWIASHFTKLRENILEEKNRELIALNRISSLTRGGITLERVIGEVIRGVTEGMGYEAALLLYRDSETDRVRFFANEAAPFVEEWKRSFGKESWPISLPLEDRNNPVFQSMLKKKVIIRYELAEVVKGCVPPLSSSQAETLQKKFGFRKFVAAPLVAEDQVLGGLVGVSRDPWIETEAVRTFEGFADQATLTIDNAVLIAELKKKNLELERVSRVKSEFLATMSHELRTPLTAVIGFSELLLEDVMGDLNSDQKESLREILVNSENLLQLINGLLDLAKIESGKMELTIGPISMGDLLHRVERMIGSLVQKKGHELAIQMREPFPLVYADERKLQQILLNLISNAIKFTPETGRIDVAVDYLEGESGPGRLEISVSDNGIGIDHQERDRIFDSFSQLDSSYTKEYQGTGLGLALVKKFIELHGGHIRVESESGKGSRFVFSIPDARPS